MPTALLLEGEKSELEEVVEDLQTRRFRAWE